MPVPTTDVELDFKQKDLKKYLFLRSELWNEMMEVNALRTTFLPFCPHSRSSQSKAQANYFCPIYHKI